MQPVREIVVSTRASNRLAYARNWLQALAPGTQALVLAHSTEAADDFVRSIAARRGAIFAVHRLTINRLAGLLAAESAATEGLAYITGLAAQAVAARALFTLKGDPRLAPLKSVLALPGLARAIASTYTEISHTRCPIERLSELSDYGVALATIFEQFEAQLRDGGLIDRAGILRAAMQALATPVVPRFAGLPTLILDCAIDSVLERDLIAALAEHSPSMLAVAPAADTRTIEFLKNALEAVPHRLEREPGAALNSLARVQDFLFDGAVHEPPVLDDSVSLTSAAGEMQECVEIARRIHDAARRGIPFDRIAVLLHAPARYAPHLEEALARASIPAWFARGTVRPEPGGRALLAILNCAAENFSARRFAEYLSLAQVPDMEDVSPAAVDKDFVPAEPDFLPEDLGLTTDALDQGLESDPTPSVDRDARAPWRWERVLTDAAVINGHARWSTRLYGLEQELQVRRRELDEDDARRTSIDRALVDLAHLRAFALPVIDALAALPSYATWGEWLDHLRGLVALALRDRTVVLAALAELEPMAPISGITLDEVRVVLSARMGQLEKPPPRNRYGAVFVAPTALARGLEFDLTIVPGLAERVLPQKLTEDPLLPDALRLRLDARMRTQLDRAAAERLALGLAVGVARTSAAFSYPRLDLDQGRPRVPSFYALEILRAAEGKLPGFDELARRAAGESRARLGWPAPENSACAIDEAEFDLAVLDRISGTASDAVLGAAHYLLDANPHLGRALRARARRWRHLWTRNDGLVDPTAEERVALEPHQLATRSYSPTALQNYASCPYKFFLQAILRLAPRDEIAAIEAIDPLTRGGLFHEVVFDTLSTLRDASMLPVCRANLDACYQTLEQSLIKTAQNFHDKLAPAIERVWNDGIDSIHADLREWMRRMAEDGTCHRPERFELSFGLVDRVQADPASVAEPVPLAAGIKLRGSIDLVERGPDGLRVTDHKTGKARASKNLIIEGGTALQPVLYALATERLLGERVAAGRLYYCTAAGSYEERVVPVDQEARAAITMLAGVIGTALNDGFMPAAPDEGACDYCDYRLLCGPYEQSRVSFKRETKGAQQRLADLDRLRATR